MIRVKNSSRLDFEKLTGEIKIFHLIFLWQCKKFR